jgi:hypothetical protein
MFSIRYKRAAAPFFILHGAGAETYYGVFSHNVLPGRITPVNIAVGLLKWLAFVAAPAWIGFLIFKRVRSKDQRAISRWIFVLYVAICYFATLKSFWQFLTAEDFLPFYPLVMLVVAGALVPSIDFLKTRTRVVLQGLPGFLSLGGLFDTD